MKEELINRIAIQSKQSVETVRETVDLFLSELASEFAYGNSVNLGPKFGTFNVKRRDGLPRIDSLHTPKKPYYLVDFKAGPELKRRLKDETWSPKKI